MQRARVVIDHDAWSTSVDHAARPIATVPLPVVRPRGAVDRIDVADIDG